MGIQFTGLASGLDTKTIIADLMKVERTKVEKIQKNKTLVEWKKDAWKDMNSKLFTFYKESVFKLKSTSTFTKKTVTSSDTSLITATANSSTTTGIHTLENIQMAKASFLTADAVESVKVGGPTTITGATTAGDLIDFTSPVRTVAEFKIKLNTDDGLEPYSILEVKPTDTLADIIAGIEALDLDINVNYDSTFNRIFVSSKNTGDNVHIGVDGDADLLSALGFEGATLVGSQGENASFTYNQTAFTSESNEITINGLSLSLRGEGVSATVSVNQDVEGIYESVKSFVTKYNELMLDATLKLDAESTRKYKPLTSEEKEAMSEDEVKLWEAKIKSSLFRNDDILTSVTSSMRSIFTFSAGVTTTGFDYTNISTLGIVTGEYTEKGILHIEGDEEDALYGLKADKLRKAIEDDPEGVLELMTALGTKMYEDMGNRMKSSTLSSALTFYNDKHIDNQVRDYGADIDDLEERLISVEQRYYKQFTAMEQAMQKSNSTSEWLTQQLGGM